MYLSVYGEDKKWCVGYLSESFKLLSVYKQKKCISDFELSVGNDPHGISRASMKYKNDGNFLSITTNKRTDGMKDR